MKKVSREKLFLGLGCDLFYEFVEAILFQTDTFAAEIFADVFTKILTLLGCEKETSSGTKGQTCESCNGYIEVFHNFYNY